MKARDKRDITQNNVCNTYVHAHTWPTALGHFYEGVDSTKREAFGLLLAKDKEQQQLSIMNAKWRTSL